MNENNYENLINFKLWNIEIRNRTELRVEKRNKKRDEEEKKLRKKRKRKVKQRKNKGYEKKVKL